MRKILITDDNKLNRQILNKILSGDYEVVQAENGSEALKILAAQYRDISAVLLDILMPVLDGYGVLSAMRSDDRFSQIPVIVMTGESNPDAEMKALTLGANDFATKPYNPGVIKRRLWNLINLRETAAIVNATRIDALTGLHSRAAFFEKVSELLPGHEPGYYVLACFDIDKFKIINDRYGNAQGDEVLKTVARILHDGFAKINGIVCRIAADDFAVFYPSSEMNTPHTEEIRRAASALDGKFPPISFSVGRYIVDDLTVTPSAMYDRAVIAAESVKGRFDQNIAIYDDAMMNRIVREQEITNEMNTALQSGQFEAWYQPQYNHSTGGLIGAEALVRWRHPTKGLISPGVFIPIFERNGFIYELDKYVWEQSCILLNKWIKKGKNPLPVSVNISRYDIFHGDLVEVILGLVKKYELPTSLLRLEITESAFEQSSNKIIEIVNDFVNHGFIMEIDDFGSGYSSLNTLKDVPAQVLKLDMRFLEGEDNTTRGGSIIESVVRMTKWLGMSVIAEGVEKKEQADYLKSIGCSYVQGYLYAKPMPAAEYEALMTGEKHADMELPLKTIDTLDSYAFWDPNSIDTLIFNSYVGGACVFEYFNGTVEIIRANEKYARTLGGDGMTIDEALGFVWAEHMDEENRKILNSAVLRAIRYDTEITVNAVISGISGVRGNAYMRTSLRAIAHAGERHLFYCVIENITAEKVAEKKLLALNDKFRNANANLTNMMSDMPGGFARMRIKKNGAAVTEYINEELCRMRGMSHNAIMAEECKNATHFIHPDDVSKVVTAVKEIEETGTTGSLHYRIMRGDGEYIWFSVFGRVTHDDDGYFLNIYYSLLQNKDLVWDIIPTLLGTMMESAADIAYAKDRNLRYICCSKRFASLAGLDSPDDAVGKTDDEIFPAAFAKEHELTEKKIIKQKKPLLNSAAKIQDVTSGKDIYVMASKYPLLDNRGNAIGVYAIGHDITESRNTEARLEFLSGVFPGGIATYSISRNSVVSPTYLNDNYFKRLGYSREEYLQLSLNNPLFAVFDDDRENVTAALNNLYKENSGIISLPHRSYTKSGEVRWFNMIATVSEVSGNGLVATVIMLDISDQKNAEEEKRIHEEELRIAIEQMGNTVCEYDIATRTLRLPDSYAKSINSPVEIKDVPYCINGTDNIDSAYLASYTEFFEKILCGEKHGQMDISRKLESGVNQWGHYEFITLFDSNGKPQKAVITITDTTEREALRARYQHEQQLRLELIRNSIIFYELNISRGEITEYLSRCSDVPGMHSSAKASENVREEILSNIYPDDKDKVRNGLFIAGLKDAYTHGERSKFVEYRRNIPGVGLCWCRANVSIMMQPDTNEIIAFVYICNIDTEKRNQLTLESVLEKEIETVALINVKTGLAHIVKDATVLTGKYGEKQFVYDDALDYLVNRLVLPEDKDECRNFLRLNNLVNKLEKAQTALLAYGAKTAEGDTVRKRALAYYLDETRENIVLSRRNVTDLYAEEQRQKEILHKALNEAVEANRAKNEFLSRMSHDMRTPMNAIIGLVKLARDRITDKEGISYLENIDMSSHLLLGLINDVLDMEKIENKRIVLKDEPLTLQEFEQSIHAVIDPLMAEKNIDFTMDMASVANCITVDRLRFLQVFFNLLSNAAKFTPQGGKVSFTSQRIPDKNGKVGIRFIVSDNGCGISSSFIKKVYHPFEQEQLDISVENRGSGLGLPIAKSIIDSMGGSISVKSEIGKGTEFTVDLYVSEVKEFEEMPTSAAVDHSILNGLPILLVDDNAMNILVATKLLQRKGCVVTTAKNGVDALEKFSESKKSEFAIILMDVRMPIMNGLEASRKIRALKRKDAKTIPIVAMTADAWSEDRNETANAGMNAHITKPIEPTVLYDTICRLCADNNKG